ncbi:MAG TPA: xanthine dehydrogenase family protein molybdopterin-binding subunit [Victivallales bacterium]|nr:xanthine dehydrogenase family protein molybdopterin-binding subunit [Victivallales bacterium]
MSEYMTVGKPEKRIDAAGKVTGKTKYVGDLFLKDMKYGVILRSAHHHAEIKKIDFSEAVEIKGIVEIITYKDIPGSKKYGVIIPDRPVLACDKVRFIGEPIAIVIGESYDIAQKAMKKIKVAYKKLPAVFDPIEALKSNSIKIHNNSNLVSETNIGDGNLEKGFKAADNIFEEIFHLPTTYHAYLEQEVAAAKYDDGKVIAWVSSQTPFIDRDLISETLNIDKSEVDVRINAVGGAFGGKEDSSLPILASLAAWKIKGTVKLLNTREESINAHPKRHACEIHCKIGIRNNGKITALHVKSYVNTGPYATYGPPVAQLLTETISGVYKIDNVKGEAYLTYTNSPIAGAFRGFGVPQSNFALESMIDIMAHKLNLEPVAVRKINIFKKGDSTYTKVKVEQAENAAKCLELAINESDKLNEIPVSSGKVSGVAMGLVLQPYGLGKGVPDISKNRIECLPNGNLLIHLGAPDLGQGLKTVAAQMVAEAMEIDYSRIQVSDLSTRTSPDGGITCASRMTYCVGNSLLRAAEKLKNKILKTTAKLYNYKQDELVYKSGKVFNKNSENIVPVDLYDLTDKCNELGKQLISEGKFTFSYKNAPTHLPFGMPHVKYCFGAVVVRVEVDEELGMVELKDTVSINEIGKVINQDAAEGQVEGGVIMGMGYALTESIELKKNGKWNDSFAEYLIPTSLDSHFNIKSIFIENEDKSGPFGAKAIGEIVIVPVASAITNAIYNATGKRFKKIPIKPYDIIDQ